MTKPKVSILLPAYNHEKYIYDTVNSVLNQTYSDFEMLISDDCSTDNTAQIIKGFDDKRIKTVFFNENMGTVRCLNKLLEMAQGEYIAVLGSDDMWLPDKLLKQVNFLDENPNIAACFSRAQIIDENSCEIVGKSTFPLNIFDLCNADRISHLKYFLETGNHLCHSSLLIRHDVHKEIGNYNIVYRQLHDFDLWIRLLLKYEIYIFETPLVKYRFVESSGNISKNVLKNNLRLFNESHNIIRYFFDNVSDSDFKEMFAAYAKNGADMICEKFLAMKNGRFYCPYTALDYLMEHLDENLVKTLSDVYGITLNDIYDYTGALRYDYPKEFYIADTNDLRKGYVKRKMSSAIERLKSLRKQGD